MATDVRLVTAVLLVFATNFSFAQRCEYMIQIPRPPTPDLPVPDLSGFTWSQRPFLPAERREDVCMDEYFPGSGNSGTQVLYMEEEIEGDVAIAKLNYDGPNTPFISTFLQGSLHMLGPVIRKIPENTGDWHLVITQRQDYETPGMQRYMFQVRVDGEALVATVSLIIVNIDDNAPIIQLTERCSIPETKQPGDTYCVYNVTDADGEISTRFMRFELESDRNDAEFFEFRGDNEPGQWMWMHMTLVLKSPLNFAENELHIFRVTALDSLPNTHTVTAMVEVENVESRPPMWMEIFAMQQFDEKTYQQFTVRAIDGDTGINRQIHYRLEREESETFFRIEPVAGSKNEAIFYVDHIDRDTLEKEVFQLSIVAYKNDDNGNEAYSTAANIVIIVDDINDQFPRPFTTEYNIAIMEETAMTLNLENFGFHDRDLGPNAQYEVRIVEIQPAGAAAAFYVAPEVGYQRQSFILGTINHRLLDYDKIEDEELIFKNVILDIVATDLANSSHVGVARVNIDLVNWNDEEPIFEQSSQTVAFDETEGAGFYVAKFTANDRDIDDILEYRLLGNAADFLEIDKATGEVYVAKDDSFNYHRQNEIFVQVQVTDTLGDGPYHTATSQLIIQLNDINNTPPTLRLPRRSRDVEENVPEGYEITDEIVATDPDTTAELRFEIDWDTSYATKQGRETPPAEYHGCVDIVTVFPDPERRGSAIGVIVVKEIRENVTIDFEEFEVLYLTVRVRDLNTVLGEDYDESTFTIPITDMNDNPPVWAEGTLSQDFRVREMSARGVVIGSVLATDIDGPLYNQVRYTIFPRDDTPDDLVEIDFYTGQITVKTSSAIDADTPPRWYLYYTVIASDKCYAEDVADCPPDPTYWDTEGAITITIIDTNNKTPFPATEEFDAIVYVWENATSGEEISTIVAYDLDRDEIYHKVSYRINYVVNPRLRAFFSVDSETGVVSVDYTTDETLDRDGDEPTHRIHFDLIDNHLMNGDGNMNQNTTDILVVLLDVNDNAPELPPPEALSWTISENLDAGERVLPEIYAPDRDEPDTDNSRVGYAIEDLTVTNRDIELPQLFTMIQIENVTGELETVRHLQGYWGTYAIHILAYDHGHPQQSSEETYQLVIRPWNFHEPVFVFPQHNDVIRLARERISENGVLTTVQQQSLDRIRATDEDGLHAGTVTFEVVGNSEAVSFFSIVNEGDNAGLLILQSTFSEEIREFTVTIRGTDGGTEPGPRHADCTVRLVFVPTQGEPTFSVNTAEVAFFEDEEGMSERFQLPTAEDPKNHLCDGDCLDIYYVISGGNTAGHFAVDPATNEIYLLKQLDREEATTHTVTVVAINNRDNYNVLPYNTLTVTVNVREANPRPIFVSKLYMAGISTLDFVNRVLLTVQATHTEGAEITYEIDHSTMKVDSSLEAVKDSAFVLNPQTGVLSLNIQPTASMHGLFEFEVVARDPSGATDRAQVRIYLISSLNRVTFSFGNSLQQIEQNTDFVAQTFSTGFGMTCNIDQVLPATDEQGLALDDSTDVRAHFIRDNAPVPADEIEQIRSDTNLIRTIQLTLRTELLILQDFVTDVTPLPEVDSSLLTVYVLAALTAVLSFLCFVLLLTYIIRTRALNRRLEALSMTKYGSVDSGLNRAGLAAPGTNKHAIEGSNPIWNETVKAPDFDALSDVSDDSDLIGIEDLPQFRSDYFPPADDNSMQGVILNESAPVATHGNHFGFNATPFSPNFGNTPIRR